MRYGEEECDRVDVAGDELERERVDPEVFAHPDEEAVDCGDKGDSGEDACAVRRLVGEVL